MANYQKKDVVVGQRQVVRELKQLNIAQIILASDADTAYKNNILGYARQYNVPVVSGVTSVELAERYGIEVKSAVVGVLKQPLAD